VKKTSCLFVFCCGLILAAAGCGDLEREDQGLGTATSQDTIVAGQSTQLQTTIPQDTDEILVPASSDTESTAPEPTPATTLAPADPNLVESPRRYEETHPYLDWRGGWNPYSDSKASGGGQTESGDETARVRVFFEGTGVRLVAPTGPWGGGIALDIEGYATGTKRTETVSLYSARIQHQQEVWYSGYLAPGRYVLTLAYDRANSWGTAIAVDAIDVWGTVLAP
jgi:hypothetical protein